MKLYDLAGETVFRVVNGDDNLQSMSYLVDNIPVRYGFDPSKMSLEEAKEKFQK